MPTNTSTRKGESLCVAGVTLEGVALGGWRTSIRCPDLRSVFDVGSEHHISEDNYFITHGHPDHLKGLFGVLSQRVLMELPLPNIYAPERVAQPLNKALHHLGVAFGGWRGGVTPQVKSFSPGQEVLLSKDLFIRGYKTFHRPDKEGFSVGYIAFKTTRKLKPEFKKKPEESNRDFGKRMGALRKAKVDIEYQTSWPWVAIPGDTKIEFLLEHEDARKAKVLIHEVTFWDSAKSTVEKTRRQGHTHVDEMIKHCEKFEGSALVLVHRSPRYTRSEIETIMRRRFPSKVVPKVHFLDGERV